MDLPDVSKLPMLAQVVFFACAGLVYAVIHFGVVSGRKTPADKRGGAEIVALTVDSRAIDKLSGEVAGVGVAIEQFVVVGRTAVEAATEQGQQVAALGNEVRQLTREIGELRHEVSKVKP